MSPRKKRSRPAAPAFSPDALVREAPEHYGAGQAPRLVWQDEGRGLWLYQGDSLILLEQIARRYPDGLFDLIFADPPYFLSKGGITCRAGRMVSVDKGEWDKIDTVERMHAFNRAWLGACRKVLRPNGTIFVSGTRHVIFSVGFAMQQLGFKLLNDIVWVKPNPPPNLSCRYFTHASETIIWAAKDKKSRPYLCPGRRRTPPLCPEVKTQPSGARWNKRDVSVYLNVKPPRKAEKAFGRHPAQKPERLLEILIGAGTPKGRIVFDPFFGSGTTGVVAARMGRKCVGCDLSGEYLAVAVRRLEAVAKGGA